VFAAAETRSFARAKLVFDKVGGAVVSTNSTERVVGDVGGELAERRDADPKTAEPLAQRPESPPALAVVECDGGHIRAREPGRGPGVHLSGEGWRETKNACLIRATHETFDVDPQPEPPACFCNPQHVAKLAEAVLSNVIAEQRRRRWPRLVLKEPCGHAPRGVIDHHHQDGPTAPAFKPVVAGAVRLHQLPVVFLPGTTTTMWLPGPPPLP
jgi:hypothetical protein